MIRLENITHAYRGKQVLRDLTLQVTSGELTCFLGSSGSGKTTLLRLIAGLEMPEKGRILIDGKTATDGKQLLIPPHQRDTGFIFQDLALWSHFTVYKNIAFGLTERKEKDVEKRVMEMLSFFGLESHAGKYPHQLSGGQKQLVAIARSLVLRPKILLMDEPLANLDVKLKQKILTLIKELQSKFDLTIVYVTHDQNEAFAIADKIVVLHEGKIEISGTPEMIRGSENEYVRYFFSGGG